MDSIKSTIHQVLQKMSGSHSTPERMEARIIEQWTQEEQKHIRLMGMKDNTIAFQVDTPTWMYHFENQKTRILKRIQMVQPHILNVRFKLGKIT